MRSVPVTLAVVLLAFVVPECAVAAADASQVSLTLEEVAVSERTAQRLGLRVSDVIEVGGDPSLSRPRRVRVAAIWSSGEHPADVARGDLLLRFHLPTLESLLDRRDVVDRIVVRLRDAALGPRVRDDLRALAAGYDVYTADELVAHTSRTFVVVSRFHRAIALITVLASGIFLITIMTLKLTEMRREIGALRLLGIGRGTIGLTVAAVAAAVAVMGTVIGAGLGAVLVWGINAYYQPLFGTRLRFAVIVPETLLVAVGFAIVLSLAAGVGVALRLLSRHPLDQVGR